MPDPTIVLSLSSIPNSVALWEMFEGAGPMTVGIEEEVMLLAPDSLDLAPFAPSVVEELSDPRFKAELPAAQLELISAPAATVKDASRELSGARRELVEATAGRYLPAAAGTHPFTAPVGAVNPAPRYVRTLDRYGLVARRQLVFGLHVHVAVAGADRALAVYNALRSYLPELAALGANAPLVGGVDSGLASMRPTIADQLPRQGVPPVIDSWSSFAEALAWGAAIGSIGHPRQWWWELRPHPQLGTLEVRVPDAQSEVWQAAAIAAVVHSLVAWLAERHDAGETLPVAASWRIAENRWSACRFGLSGQLADLATGSLTPTRDRLIRLIERLEPTAARLGAGAELASAALLTEGGGAERQRAMLGERGAFGTVEWLVESFLAGPTAAPPS